MNPKLRVEIEADIKGMETELKKADSLLEQHQRNFQRIQQTIGQNAQRARELERALQNLNNQYRTGAITEKRYQQETDRVSQELREVNHETTLYQRELVRLRGEINRLTSASQTYQSSAKSNAGALQNQTRQTAKMARTTNMNALPAMTSLAGVMTSSGNGIQGVASSIQMLTGQMGYLSNSAGSVTNAFRHMAASLMGPAGILLAVSLVAGAVMRYSEEINDLIRGTDKLAKATTEFAAAANAEIVSLNSLLAVARNENESKETRLKAINQINDEYGDYIGNLKLEEVNSKKTTDAVNRHAEAIMRRAKVRGAEAVIEEESRKLAEQTAKARREAESMFQDGQLYGSGQQASLRRRELREQISTWEQSLSLMEQQAAAGEDVADGMEEVTARIAELKKEITDPNAFREGFIADYINKETAEAQGAMENLSKSLQDALSGHFEFNATANVTDVNKGGVEPVVIQAVLDMPDMPGSMGGIASEDREQINLWEKEIEILERTRKNYAQTDSAYKLLSERIARHTENIARVQAGLEPLLMGISAPLMETPPKMANLAQAGADMGDEVSRAAQQANRAIQGMVSGMINSMIRGEMKAEDFAKNILSSLASIALTSLMGPGAGIFGSLFGGGGAQASLAGNSVRPMGLSLGSSPALSAGSSGAQMNIGVQDIVIDGDKLRIVMGRAMDRHNRVG